MAPLKLATIKHKPLVYDYSFVQTKEWLDELEQRVHSLPFNQAKKVYQALSGLLTAYGSMEIKEAANWIMATLSHLHSSFYDGPAATNFVFPGDLLTINAIRSYCWNPPTPPIPVPQLATILPAILAVGGLIKLAATTKVIPNAVKTDEQAEIPMEGAAMFIDAVIISQVAQASEKILALEHTIEELKAKHKLEIRKKAKRKEKQKKSKAAKKGHATKNDAKKAKAIEMYKSGSYHSVLQAAAKIAPEVGLSESTVKKLLYKLKNNHT